MRGRQPRTSPVGLRSVWSTPGGSNADFELRRLASCPLDEGRINFGTGTTGRTWNLLFQRQPLCQLSYPGVAGSGGIEPPKPASKAGGLPLTELPKWGDRRESNPRGLVHSQSPEPLGYGHTWCWRRRSHPRLLGFNQPLHYLSYSSEIGGRPGN